MNYYATPGSDEIQFENTPPPTLARKGNMFGRLSTVICPRGIRAYRISVHRSVQRTRVVFTEKNRFVRKRTPQGLQHKGTLATFTTRPVNEGKYFTVFFGNRHEWCHVCTYIGQCSKFVCKKKVKVKNIRTVVQHIIP